ncbi:MAG: DUF1552 domain-containing protein [Planctomycetia bacterium]|nr:DUF1552 domain-containing protein [Planctomycetia bacterium]
MSAAKPFRMSRKAFLRGAGAMLGLPYLEAMMPSGVLASAMPNTPARMGMFYFGTGMNTWQLFPEDFGRDYKMTRILKPLESLRNEFTILSGTMLGKGGGHDGAYPFSTAIAKGEKQRVSPDQVAAAAIGRDTRYASLQLSVERGTAFGSQALATISWNEQGVPLAAENDPHVLFNRLFRPDNAAEHEQRKHEFRRRGSILDLVQEDAKQLNLRVGSADKQQLEQYFNSIRELEKQLERRISWSDKSKPAPDTAGMGDFGKSIKPEGNGDFLYDDYAKLMYDLIALAFQTDSSRIVSYVVRKELAGGVYPEFGVSKDYHSLTHHGNDPQNLEELAKVDTIYMQHWAYFLNRLKSVKEGDGTLLDHTVLGLSSGMGMGHSKDQLPTIVSGGRGLGMTHQGHLKLKNAPLASVWHTMLDRIQVPVVGQFQDSTGPIKELIGA